MKNRELRTDTANGAKYVRPVKVRRAPACDHCGEPLTENDRDGRVNPLGFKVRCETCHRPLTLCEICWNDSDDCPECEQKREREMWCPLCDLPLGNLSSEDRRRHYLGHKD
jgi:hypothetical protein